MQLVRLRCRSLRHYSYAEEGLCGSSGGDSSSDDDAETGLGSIYPGEGYALLGLETYFTAGEKEVRAWTIKKGTSAPQAAGVIHTDFERGFIRAQVIDYDSYIELKGEAGAKAAGKMKVEGKEYIVQDGDVMHFLFNV